MGRKPSRRVIRDKKHRNPIPSDVADITEQDFLKLFGTSLEEVEALPKITEYLEKHVGDRSEVLRLLRACNDPEAREVVDAHRKVSNRSWVSGMISIEALAAIAKVSTRRVLEMVLAEAVMETSIRTKGKFMEVVDGMFESAKIPGREGFQDRKMLAQHVGFAPVPRTSVTNIFGGAAIDARQQTQNVAILPQVEDGVRRMTDRFNATVVEVKQLEAPEDEESDD